MKFEMMEKKYCRQQEPNSERWENICRNDGFWMNRKMFHLWMDIIHLGKDELLVKTFGKPTCHIIYSYRNKVWGIKYKGFDFFFFRSTRGDCLQVDGNTPAKVCHAFVEDLHKTWKPEVDAWHAEQKKMRKGK